MILIIDCGATKADWALQGGKHFRTEGFNLAHTPKDALRAILDGAAAKAGPGVTEVHFYAAGLVGESPIDLGQWFPGAEIEYASDMVAAARAVCGNRPGIAAIIGTGSNTCQWDGTCISRKVNSGGFIVGDEGSASVLGKLFVTDYLKGCVPSAIAEEFASRFEAGYGSIVKGVYASAAPARYLGGFAPFILEHYADPYVKALVDDNFRRFLERTILRYDRLHVGVVGGFGRACRDILEAIGKEYGVEFKIFMDSPLEGLLKYHGI
ncbi:MAG: hypothetical protein IJK44_04260 [Bacteroidales bacterium]|nr:hypothetical protein [Bacteroidales bacterium]